MNQYVRDGSKTAQTLQLSSSGSSERHAIISGRVVSNVSKSAGRLGFVSGIHVNVRDELYVSQEGLLISP